MDDDNASYDKAKLPQGRAEFRDLLRRMRPDIVSVWYELADGDKLHIRGGLSKMTLVMGLPAVGKSTVYTNPTSEKTGAFILDCDVVKTMLPEYKESHGGASDSVHWESLNIMDDAMQAFLTGDKQGMNVILPIVATDFDKLMEKYIKPFEAAGYDVRAVFLIASENVSFARNIARQLDTGRVFRSSVTMSFGKKPEKVYYRLKNMTNAKGHPYGMAEYPYQEH